MKKLYAPWRSSYTDRVLQENDDESDKNCVFCQQIQQKDDKKNFILGRFSHAMVMLNLYPYNAGHILIVPNNHKAHLEDLSANERFELMELTNKTVTILKKIMNAQGINIGLNLGKAAGAGIPHHLHMHVLPRWQGDTNFLPLLADTKQISFDLHQIYETLLPHFK